MDGEHESVADAVVTPARKDDAYDVPLRHLSQSECFLYLGPKRK
jgi:hypothetical protein